MTTDFTGLHKGSWLFPSRVDSENEARCRVRYGIPILGGYSCNSDVLDKSSLLCTVKREVASSQSSSYRGMVE